MPEIRVTNYNMAIARIIAALLVAPLLGLIGIALLWSAWEKAELSPVHIIAGLTGVVGFIVFLWMGGRAVLWIGFGDEIRVRRVTGRKVVPYDSIHHVNFAIEETRVRMIPVARTRVMLMALKPKGVLETRVTPEQEARIRELLSQRDVHIHEGIGAEA